MKKEMHLVTIATGSYDDYHESSIFVTDDKEKALLWVEKYNKIIKDNTDRIVNYVFKEEQEKEPFWYWLIAYEKPIAIVRQVEHRP